MTLCLLQTADRARVAPRSSQQPQPATVGPPGAWPIARSAADQMNRATG
jgi:hypothetical protein